MKEEQVKRIPGGNRQVEEGKQSVRGNIPNRSVVGNAEIGIYTRGRQAVGSAALKTGKAGNLKEAGRQ